MFTSVARATVANDHSRLVLYAGRTTLVYEMPMAELVTDLFDHVKSRSRGYASMEYQFLEYRQNDLVRLDVAVNGDTVDAMSCIVHRDRHYAVGKGMVTKLKEIIPRTSFKIQIQALVNGKSIASTTISALRKGTMQSEAGNLGHSFGNGANGVLRFLPSPISDSVAFTLLLIDRGRRFGQVLWGRYFPKEGGSSCLSRIQHLSLRQVGLLSIPNEPPLELGL